MKTIVLWEFAKKQNYIFKSNKLMENIGASLIVKDVSEIDEKYNLNDNQFITRGGGKSIYLFNSDEEASAFIKRYSKDILKEYPGVDMFFVKADFNEETDNICNIIDKLYNKLEIKKNKRESMGDLVGFGIERKCIATSLPASFNDKGDYVSAEIMKKREYSQNQNKDFNELIPEGYKLEKEIGKIIKKENKNYIAIVHIDGNNMGKRLKEIVNNINTSKKEYDIKTYNKKYMNIMREVSEKVDSIYKGAFKKMVDVVIKNQDKLKEYCNIENKVLPIRPLILAGDDVTFICPGVIGIECARIMLDKISEYDMEVNGTKMDKLTACAGISIIKSGYPFIRAYNMAEDLCQNAKKLVLDSKSNINALDYHISMGEINSSINDIRKKYYTSSDSSIDGNLTLKPLYVGNTEKLETRKKYHNYGNLCLAINNVTDAINDKNIARGKVKELRSVMKNGTSDTEHYCKFYKLGAGNYLRPLNGMNGDYCFNTENNNKECMYLDAIETYECFVKLDE